MSIPIHAHGLCLEENFLALPIVETRRKAESQCPGSNPGLLATVDSSMVEHRSPPDSLRIPHEDSRSNQVAPFTFLAVPVLDDSRPLKRKRLLGCRNCSARACEAQASTRRSARTTRYSRTPAAARNNTFQADSLSLTGFQRLYPPSDRQPWRRALRSSLTRSCLHASSWIATKSASCRTTPCPGKYPWNLNGPARQDHQPRPAPLIP